MNIDNLTEQQQQQALLDLAMLAMYADGHLASAEDERVHRLLAAMGFATDWDRGKHYDASISRVSRHSQSAESARTYAATLSRSFSTPEHRRFVQATLNEIVTSDNSVAPQERSFLSLVREAVET